MKHRESIETGQMFEVMPKGVAHLQREQPTNAADVHRCRGHRVVGHPDPHRPAFVGEGGIRDQSMIPAIDLDGPGIRPKSQSRRSRIAASRAASSSPDSSEAIDVSNATRASSRCVETSVAKFRVFDSSRPSASTSSKRMK